MRLAPHGIKGERRLMSSLRAFRRDAHLPIDLRKVHIGLHLLQELDNLCACNVSKRLLCRSSPGKAGFNISAQGQHYLQVSHAIVLRSAHTKPSVRHLLLHTSRPTASAGSPRMALPHRLLWEGYL
ncbi:hypothetical protein KC356_g297 [Hortaea werneckii]|nr:hypothetical protein KC356_g297 [Hortaea werneckii]